MDTMQQRNSTRGLRWWLRIVGVFYLLLTVMNLYGLFIDNSLFRTAIPYTPETNTINAFQDAWMVFVFELGALGAAMLYASIDIHGSRALVIAVILAELFRGAVADALWITRGYAVSSYLPFIIIHLIIIATGFLAVRPLFNAGKDA